MTLGGSAASVLPGLVMPPGASKLIISASIIKLCSRIHGMYDVTSGIAVNGEIGRWAFEMCA